MFDAVARVLTIYTNLKLNLLKYYSHLKFTVSVREDTNRSEQLLLITTWAF